MTDKKNKSSHQEKPWWKSKTLFLNLVLFGVAIIDIVAETRWIEPQYLLVVGGVLNAVLRIWFSDSKLT